MLSPNPDHNSNSSTPEKAPENLSYRVCKNPLLDATARIVEGRVKVKASGPLSVLPLVRSSLEMIDGQIPVMIGEKLCLSTWIPPIPSPAFDRLAMSRIKSSFGFRTPDQVTISITEECPNRCVHCALPDSGKKLRLEPETVRKVISQALDLGTTLIIFDGGEPALYKELPDLVHAVDDRAISTLFTSGAGFTAPLAQRLKKAGLYAVNISLDSPLPEEHDAMRGRFGVFQDALTAAKNALSAGLLVDIYVVLRHDNIHQLLGFQELSMRIGAQELTFFEVVPVGRWAGRRKVILTPEDHLSLNSFVSDASAASAASSAGPRIFSVPEAFRRFGCFAGRSWAHVTPLGDVYPCACLPESYGNIHSESLSTIWRRMGSLPYKGVRRCPMRNI